MKETDAGKKQRKQLEIRRMLEEERRRWKCRSRTA